MPKLLVGAGKVCIDPTEDMYPLPDPRPDRAGKPYVQSARYDSCFCRALALVWGEQKALLLCYDLVSVPAVDDFRRLLSESTGVPEAHIYITATHNHTAPFDRGGRPLAAIPVPGRDWYVRYEEIEREAGIWAATEAISALRPAGARYGTGESHINVNRNLQTPGGCWVEGADFAGFSDKTLAVFKFEDEKGRLIAALLNHATHATCGLKMPDAQGRGVTSGNFPGVTCRFLEERYQADGAVVLWTSGAAGDQGPVLPYGLQMEYPDGYTTLVEYPAGTGPLQIEYLGRLHGADAVKVPTKPIEGAEGLIFSETEVSLPAQKQVGGPRGPFRMGGFGPRPQGEVSVKEPTAEPIMAPDEEHPGTLKMRAMRLGGITLLFLNAEISARMGMRIKALRPEDETVIIQHTGKGAGDILDETQKGQKVIQAYGRIVPGTSDEKILQAVDGLLKALDAGGVDHADT